MKKGMAFRVVACAVSAFLILTSIALTIVNSNATIHGLKMMWIIGYNTTISEGDRQKVESDGEALAESIESEGIVLAKNAGGLLPLSYEATKAKGVNVFGWSSTSWVPGGSGSGRVTRRDDNRYAEIGIVNALTMAGIDYNTELYKFYMNHIPSLNGSGSSGNTGLKTYDGSTSINGNNRPNWTTGNGGTLSSYDFQFSRLIEPTMSSYPEGLKTDAEGFSDVAIVVISRVSGESNDSPRVQYKGNVPSDLTQASVIGDATRHYLEISTEEEDMLTYVGANFDKTVVLINSTNTMELGFMDTIAGLDACLIVGATGTNAATAIPKVMFDKVPLDADGVLHPDGTLTDGIVPSGRLADTYAYDLKTAASWANSGDSNQSSAATTSGTGLSAANAPTEFGQNYYTGVTKADSLYPFGPSSGDAGSGPSNGNFTSGYRSDGYLGLAYMDYSEGIYVGYKWYETADTMGYWNSPTGYWNSSSYSKKPAGTTGYNAVVQYPFGHGLSYTTFKWDFLKSEPSNNTTLTKDGKIEVYVNVTNTGTKAGKDVVQAYVTPPYISRKVEKASVNLVAFEKTPLLQPGETQAVMLSFDVYDMASYDAYNLSGLVGENGGFMLDAGEYEISLRQNAHSPATVTDLPGAHLTFRVPASGYVYDTDPVSGNEVSNQFTGSIVKQPGYDQVALDGSEESVPVEYMTRANFASTFPQLKEARAITTGVKEMNSFTSAMEAEWAARNSSGPPTQGAPGNLKVWDSAKVPVNFESDTEDADARFEESVIWYNETDGLARTKLTELGYQLAQNYDDPEWEAVLNQVPLNVLNSDNKGTGMTIMPGTLGEVAISAIGKPDTISLDGPNMWSSFASIGKGVGFPNSTVTAQTFNKYLAYRMGLQFGKDAVAGGGNGWLGPGINIHRSPLGGRNYEYYSEDAYLSGIMCAEAVKGAKNMGIYVYLKHLALYEQESNRDSLYVWLTEQALREIYLKPFRIAILEYSETGHGATGIMTAYGRIGAVWTGGSYPLITGVVRNEWDFKGAVLTDWSDHRYFMNMSHALRAGGDIGINCGWSAVDNSTTRASGAFLQAARGAVKNITYMWMQAQYMAANYNPTQDYEQLLGNVERIPNFDWITFLVGIFWGVAIIGSGTLIFFAFVKPNLKDKEPQSEQES